MLAPLIMDAIVAALLVATICFAIKLNGRLAALRRDSERLQGLIRDLQGASGAAEDAVTALKLTAGDAGRTLQGTIDGARTLESDLRFMIERADDVANRLEAGLRVQRDQQAAASPSAPASHSVPPAAAAAADKNNQSRLAMLLKQAEAADAQSSRNEASLDGQRPKGRAAAPREPAWSPPPRQPEPRAEPRTEPRAEPRGAEGRGAEPRGTETAPQSRAERDLLRALEARTRQ